MITRLPLVLIAVAGSLFVSDVRAGDGSAFVGNWQGEHAGKTYLVMTIDAGAPLKVSISSAVIYVDESGEIRRIEGRVEHNETVLETRIRNGRLRVKTRQGDGDIAEYEMTLDGKSAANLTVLGAPANVKPFRLQRSNREPAGQ